MFSISKLLLTSKLVTMSVVAFQLLLLLLLFFSLPFSGGEIFLLLRLFLFTFAASEKEESKNQDINEFSK